MAQPSTLWRAQPYLSCLRTEEIRMRSVIAKKPSYLRLILILILIGIGFEEIRSCLAAFCKRLDCLTV